MIDLSADLGEGSPGEEEIWPLITSANVACGGHIGDADSMAYAARRARDLSVRLGAHPSYPDRENFGRKPLDMMPLDLRASLTAQIGTLRDIAARHGAPLTHVKPHGALYNQAHHDDALAGVIVDAMRAVDPALALVCSATSQMAVAPTAATSTTAPSPRAVLRAPCSRSTKPPNRPPCSPASAPSSPATAPASASPTTPSVSTQTWRGRWSG